MSETHPNQGERFEDDQIAGHEQTVVPLNKLHGRLMKSICAISECKVRRRCQQISRYERFSLWPSRLLVEVGIVLRTDIGEATRADACHR